MTPPQAVLNQYALPRFTWQSIGNGSGFSGASIWRGDHQGQPTIALKAWPTQFPVGKLQQIHEWMRQAEGCGVLPRIVPTTQGETSLPFNGKLWEATTWMPGTANFVEEPNDARLTDAVQRLAELHRIWANDCQRCVSEGVRRRVKTLQELLSPLSLQGRGEENKNLILPETVRQTLLQEVRRTLPLLQQTQLLPMFPCLCDPWQTHWLFTGDKLSGIIDMGAMRRDHPAIDLARMLGDFGNGEAALIDKGVTLYNASRPPFSIEPGFVKLLDVTGRICGIVAWCRRSAQPPERFQRLLDGFAMHG